MESTYMRVASIIASVEHTVRVDAGGYPYIPQIELYDYENDIPLAKAGDKVKLIIIKGG